MSFWLSTVGIFWGQNMSCWRLYSWEKLLLVLHWTMMQIIFQLCNLVIKELKDVQWQFTLFLSFMQFSPTCLLCWWMVRSRTLLLTVMHCFCCLLSFFHGSLCNRSSLRKLLKATKSRLFSLQHNCTSSYWEGMLQSECIIFSTILQAAKNDYTKC